MAKKSILVVEDDVGVRKVLKRFCGTMDVDLVETWTIKSALEECASRSFDLVIMDYNISNGEIGWNVAKQIRANSTMYGSPRTIATSGTVNAESTARSLGLTKAEVDEYLHKPFDLNELRSVLERLLGI